VTAAAFWIDSPRTATYCARVTPASGCDVLVIGGGPAGSTAAQLLASWGRSVVLVHRPASQALAESLPPSTRKLLAFLGQLDGVDASNSYPNSGNVVHWAGEVRTIASPDAGFHVSRARFDAVLLDAARAAGAHVIDGVVRRIGGTDPVCVAYSAHGEADGVCDARIVLDCSGRAGVVARRGLRRYDPRSRTLAVVAEWECERWPVDEQTMTTVESYADGWSWSVPLSATRRQCTIMIDRAAFAADRSAKAVALQAVYECELAKARALASRLASARQLSAPWCCDSSVYDASRAADGPMLLVGDAASFIEPLSSAGVKKALVSAWRAAVVANTCLADTAMASSAIDLHIRREKEVYVECQRRSAVLFGEAAATYGTPFWAERADACAGGIAALNDCTTSMADATAAPIADPAANADYWTESGILEAFERLRRAARVRLRPSPSIRFAPVPVIDGRQVVLREAIVVPGRDTPLQFAAGIDLTSLVRIAAACGEVPSIIDAYQRRVGPAPAAGLLTGLSLLVAREALVAEDAPL